jgi:hypothetical protein
MRVPPVECHSTLVASPHPAVPDDPLSAGEGDPSAPSAGYPDRAEAVVQVDRTNDHLPVHPAAPEFTPPTPTSDERDLLLGFLDWKRAALLDTANGLTDEQARWTPEGKLLPIAGIINHVTLVEARWVDGRYLRKEPPQDGAEVEFATQLPLEAIVAAYCERRLRTNEIIRSAPSLDAACLGHASQPPRPGLDLRYVVVHLIDETAQHAGHANATRELLDGHHSTK